MFFFNVHFYLPGGVYSYGAELQDWKTAGWLCDLPNKVLLYIYIIVYTKWSYVQKNYVGETADSLTQPQLNGHA